MSWSSYLEETSKEVAPLEPYTNPGESPRLAHPGDDAGCTPVTPQAQRVCGSDVRAPLTSDISVRKPDQGPP